MKLAPKKKNRHIRSNPDPSPPPVFNNPNLINKNYKNQKGIEQSPDSSPEAVQHNFIPTPSKPTVHIRTPHSPPSSSSTPQNLFSTPNTHTVPITPVVQIIPLIPVNMANRYAPLQLPQ